MASGIYALYWWKEDLVYIGLSQDLHTRRRDHISDMENNRHTNFKVQSAYTKFGYPEFIVLENCKISQLCTLERVWQKEFNSISSLDIVEAGQVGFGANSNASKYSKFTLLKVFSLLYTNRLKTFKNIAIRCKLPNTSLIRDIFGSNTHLWLKEEYPLQYAEMKAIDYKSQAAWGTHYKNYVALVDPDGLVVRIDECVINTAKNIKEIYFPHDEVEVIRKGISRVLSGKRKSWRGWTLEQN
jgi:hypothetical protein